MCICIRYVHMHVNTPSQYECANNCVSVCVRAHLIAAVPAAAALIYHIYGNDPSMHSLQL